MLVISLKSYDPSLLNSFCEKIKKQGPFENLKGPIFLPKKSKLYTVIRSSHVFSLSREQFELCTYRRAFVLSNNFDFTLKDDKSFKNFKYSFYKYGCIQKGLFVYYDFYCYF